MERNRCAWVANADAVYLAYHDDEWGVPSRDERHLFELLILEGAQAGLSWSTILRKRDGYRRAFAGFEIETIARFGEDDVQRLMQNAGIVRNRAKIEATITNARACLDLSSELGGLGTFLWSFVGGVARQNAWRSLSEMPAETAESRAMSKDLRRRGFKFVGPTICYAFMQTAGLVNDHTVDCFRYAELSKGTSLSTGSAQAT
jgi:DNA-3-methyladenine glycosylase I